VACPDIHILTYMSDLRAAGEIGKALRSGTPESGFFLFLIVNAIFQTMVIMYLLVYQSRV